MYDRALVFASGKHQGQVRKSTGVPYIEHPIRVSQIVEQYKVSTHIEELRVAALLHDTLEDTHTTAEEIARYFGGMVASLVVELTSDADRIASMGKLAYLKKKLQGMSSYALVVKLADRLDNISDHPTARMLADTQEMLLWLPKFRYLSKTQWALLNDIQKQCNRCLSS